MQNDDLILLLSIQKKEGMLEIIIMVSANLGRDKKLDTFYK